MTRESHLHLIYLLRLKDHFAFKKKRKSPEQSYFSPGDAIGMPMEEQLLAHLGAAVPAGFTGVTSGTESRHDLGERVLKFFEKA